MNRLLPLLLILLPACAGSPAPAETPAIEVPPAEEEVHEPPVPSAAPPIEQERPLPPSIFIDASVTRPSNVDGKPITVNVRGGEPVPWTSEELTLELLPFDPATVDAKPRFADHWETSENEPGTVRIHSDLRGMPDDALFLELVPAESEVVWSDGSRGTFRGIHTQSQEPIGWDLGILTTVPPESPSIQSVTIALDLHRATRVRRHVASVGVGQAAVFEFGVSGSRWILQEDLEVIEFGLRRYGTPNLPLFDRGLEPDRLVGLKDASGAALQERGGGGGGSMSYTDWGFWPRREFKPPLTVTVDLPLGTTTTRILLRMKDIRPKK